MKINSRAIDMAMGRDYLKMRECGLAGYAVFSSNSKGRKFPEEPHSYRLPFQRDRERILHSAAFRRLEYKTQVFICHEGDYFRTRLTHTLEVAQIARAIGFALGLNIDLIEGLALAHDIGHTPFGHKGEDVLNELMKEEGGFEHNIHALRVVDVLEERYADRPGLNLTWEMREGIIKHSKHYPQLVEFHGEFGNCPPYLEAQVVEIADEIAYDSHDMDDALRSGMITLDDALELEICANIANTARKKFKNISGEMLRHYLVRGIITYFVDSVISSLHEGLLESKIESAQDVRELGFRLAKFPERVANAREGLRGFLVDNVYRSEEVTRIANDAGLKLRDIFLAYCSEPRLMPGHFYSRVKEGKPIKRVVCDYVAGMTDRYAINEHKKICKQN